MGNHMCNLMIKVQFIWFLGKIQTMECSVEQMYTLWDLMTSGLWLMHASRTMISFCSMYSSLLLIRIAVLKEYLLHIRIMTIWTELKILLIYWLNLEEILLKFIKELMEMKVRSKDWNQVPIWLIICLIHQKETNLKLDKQISIISGTLK